MKVICTGGRSYSNKNRVWAELSALPLKMVYVGDARGADALVRAYCEITKVPYKVFYADWGQHGKAAGPKRNIQMVDAAGPDAIVLEFPGGVGTKQCSDYAKRQGHDIRIIED